MVQNYDNHGILKNRRVNNPNLVPNLVTQVTRPDTISSGMTKPGSVIEFVSSTTGSTQLTVGVGDSIQDAINKVNSLGGGIVNLQNGFHSVQNDIFLYSNVTLQGQNALSTIIDFGGKNYSIKIWGTSLYSTGTIAINAGSITVTGSGTAWTSALNGYSIIIQGVYYTIASVNSTTSITIAETFIGTNVSGIVYSIDEPISDTKISTISIQNSLGNGIDIRNSDIAIIDTIGVFSCGTGIYINYIDAAIITQAEIIGCGYGANLNNAGSLSFTTFFINYTSTGYGISLNSVFSSTILDWSASGCAGDGMALTNCWQIDLFSGNTNSCTGNGVNMISGNLEIVHVSTSSFRNTGNGIIISSNSNYCNLIGCQFDNNGAWGINVGSGCTGNVLNGNTYVGNTSGTYTNSGTSTRIF